MNIKGILKFTIMAFFLIMGLSIIFFRMCLHGAGIVITKTDSGYVFWGNIYINEIGIVQNDQLKFYKKNNDSWNIVSERNFILPKVFNQVIGFDFNNIGIVINNEIQFYQYDNSWKNISGKVFKFPESSKGVFGVGKWGIGLVLNGKVQIYRYDNSWEKHSQIIDFILPDNYEEIYCYANSDTLIIGVTVGNTIKFYNHDIDNSSWSIISEKNFILPDHETTIISGGTKKSEYHHKNRSIVFLSNDYIGINVQNIENPYYNEFLVYWYFPEYKWNLSNSQKIYMRNLK